MTSRAVSVVFDTRVQPLIAIKKAVFKFSGRCAVRLEQSDESHVAVHLLLRDLLADSDDLEREFCAEVLDQELRELLAKETEAVRNLILAQAFSKTNLLDPVGDEAELDEDPLHIAAHDARKDRGGG